LPIISSDLILGEVNMPEQEAIERARKDKEEGKSPSTQAGEFVREEMHHIREGKHGARSPQQAIAIGLSKARRAGVELNPPEKGKASDEVASQAKRDLKKGRTPGRTRTSRTRSRATMNALKREGHSAASHQSLSRQAHRAAQRRGRGARRSAANAAVKTKGAAGLRAAGRKAATSGRRHRTS
jgi:hypothetical protein